jgi:RNA polymerase sigma factor (sigma-70 family)
LIPNFVFRRARVGDTRAIERIVAALRPRVSRMAAYYGRLGYSAADLEQEAWAEMVTALRTIDLEIGVPEQYLLQRARWRVADAVRRWRRRPTDSLGEVDGQYASLCHADDHSQTFVDDLIARLEPTQRAVMNLLLSGSTWREAGDALGFTSANVAYHVRRVRTTYLALYAD